MLWARPRCLRRRLRKLQGLLARILKWVNPEAAYHEAGHVVTAVALGIEPLRVRVFPCWADVEGQTEFLKKWPYLRDGFRPDDPQDRREAEDWMVVALAGEIAGARFRKREPDFGRDSARWDFRQALKQARRLEAGRAERRALLRRVKERARKLVHHQLRWRQIGAVAERLRSLRQLEGREVVRIMEAVDGASPFGDFELGSPPPG